MSYPVHSRRPAHRARQNGAVPLAEPRKKGSVELSPGIPCCLAQLRWRAGDETTELSPPLAERNPPCVVGRRKRGRPLDYQLLGSLLVRRLSNPY